MLPDRRVPGLCRAAGRGGRAGDADGGGPAERLDGFAAFRHGGKRYGELAASRLRPADLSRFIRDCQRRGLAPGLVSSINSASEISGYFVEGNPTTQAVVCRGFVGVPTAVSEPASLVTLGLGTFGLIAVARPNAPAP